MLTKTNGTFFKCLTTNHVFACDVSELKYSCDFRACLNIYECDDVMRSCLEKQKQHFPSETKFSWSSVKTSWHFIFSQAKRKPVDCIFFINLWSITLGRKIIYRILVLYCGLNLLNWFCDHLQQNNFYVNYSNVWTSQQFIQCHDYDKENQKIFHIVCCHDY